MLREPPPPTCRAHHRRFDGHQRRQVDLHSPDHPQKLFAYPGTMVLLEGHPAMARTAKPLPTSRTMTEVSTGTNLV